MTHACPMCPEVTPVSLQKVGRYRILGGGGAIGAQDLPHAFRILTLGKTIDEKQADLYRVFSSHKNIQEF